VKIALNANSKVSLICMCNTQPLCLPPLAEKMHFWLIPIKFMEIKRPRRVSVDRSLNNRIEIDN